MSHHWMNTVKRSLLVGSALCAAASARAQAVQGSVPEVGVDAPQSPDTTPENASADDIVVTGIRRSNVAAVKSKVNATNIIDVISANEARALPDRTIVEALRRVPGLSVLPAIDNEHPRDEATTPVIRGLNSPYNNVTIDGLTIASPGTPNGNLGSITRGVRLDLLPTSMVSEIQVVKTFTADLDPNAVGGAINLKTRSAFEAKGKPFFTMEASLGHATDTDRPADQVDVGYRVTATGSTTFGSQHQFGIVLSGNYQTLSSYTESHLTSDTIFESYYNAAGQLQSGNNLGNGYAVPQQDKYWYVQDKRDRYGLTGKFEARLADNLDGFVTGGYYFFKDDMTRNENILDPRERGTVLNQTPTSGTYPVGNVEVGYSNQKTTTRTRVGQAGLNWRPGDRQVLSLRGSYSNATYEEPIYMIKYITGTGRPAPGTNAGTTVTPSRDYGFTYDTSKLDFRFPMNPTAVNNLSNYGLFYWRPDYNRYAADKIWTGRLDYGFNQGSDDSGFGFAFGGSYTDDRPEFNINRTEYAPNTSAPVLTLADAGYISGAPLRNNGLNLITIDPDRAKAILNALPASAFNATNQLGFNNQDDFEHVEKTGGAYGLASYRSDRFNGQVGLHYDQTAQETTGRLRNAAGAYLPLTTRSNYDFLLPSAIGTFHVTPQLDLRAAASRTIGRPAYDSYAARSSVNFVNTNDVGNPNATGVTVTIGNPDIKPRRSDNLDLALDWRIPGSGGGILSLAVFNKHIKDEIFTTSTVGFTDPSSGVRYLNALVSKPINGPSARIRGVEANVVVNSFGMVAPWLSAFGASANVSLLGGRLDVPTLTSTRRINRLVGQPDYTLNANVFYNAGGLELRGAWNRQGSALRSIVSDVLWQDLYWSPRSQVDASATYYVTPAVAVVGQVSNVMHNRITSVTGPGKNLLKDSYSVPTTFWLGIRFTPRF
jgi:TonB-dependent receptor